MRNMRAKGFVFLLILVSFILIKEGILIAGDTDILHLMKKDFKTFFDQNTDWKEKFFERCHCNRWKYQFFCWNRETRKILFPNVKSYPCPDNRLPEALNNKLIKHNENIKERKTYLITNDHMVQISLQHLAKNEYTCVYRMKSLLKDKEEHIEFYIFDFTQENKENKKKEMDIYYGLRNASGKLKFETNLRYLNNRNYVKKWEGISKDIFDGKIPDIKINIKISVLIGDRTIVDIYPDTKFIHFINNEIDPPERHNKIVSTYAGNGYLINDLVFNLSNEKDLNMLKTKGIYVGPIKDEKRITYSSLYLLILESFDKINTKIKDNTFELFYARTTNFDVDSPKLSDDIKKVELPRILSSIKDIIKKRKMTKKKKPIIQLIGFADFYGKENTGWDKRNFILAKDRAKNVKKWLEDNLGSLKNEVIFDNPKGCLEEYYNYSDRCVDIKVF